MQQNRAFSAFTINRGLFLLLSFFSSSSFFLYKLLFFVNSKLSIYRTMAHLNRAWYLH